MDKQKIVSVSRCVYELIYTSDETVYRLEGSLYGDHSWEILEYNTWQPCLDITGLDLMYLEYKLEKRL